jgi:hypothetical protein
MRHHTDLLLEHLPPYSNGTVLVEAGKPNAGKGEDVDARYCMTLEKVVMAYDERTERDRDRELSSSLLAVQAVLLA